LSGTLRVLPLGGLGEIGKNMTVVEYDGSIVIVDCGLRFPTAEMPGVDLVLPDFAYLRDRADDVEAIVITHAHEDHVGALPWVLREIWGKELQDAPPVYGRKLTMAMARSRLDEHRLKEIELEDVEPGELVDAGPFTLELVHMTHSIPDASGVALTTELGTILVTGDYKFDQTPVSSKGPDFNRLARFGEEGLLLLCGDSTNVDRPGWSISEAAVGPELEKVIEQAQGRVVVTSFASNVHRVQQVIHAAAALDRRVALVGRSMRKYVNIARSLGHIQVPDGLLVQPKEMDTFPDAKLVVMSTGSQGEPGSALRRMAHNDHPAVELREGDTVVFSATPIPGNERAINETIDRLFRIGCRVVTAKDAPIHASGHGYAEEIKLMVGLTRPKYLLPFHGDHKRLRMHGELAVASGMAEDAIFRGENGLPLEIDKNGARWGKREQSGVIFVDGVDIGDVTDAALRDRRMLSADGIFVIVATISEQTGKPVADPEVIFRGVPFPEEADQLLDDLRDEIDKCLSGAAKDGTREIELLEKKLHDDLGSFVYGKIKRRPMVLPVVVEV
jgi:ribonuclease J